jgi:hypothetical protein
MSPAAWTTVVQGCTVLAQRVCEHTVDFLLHLQHLLRLLAHLPQLLVLLCLEQALQLRDLRARSERPATELAVAGPRTACTARPSADLVGRVGAEARVDVVHLALRRETQRCGREGARASAAHTKTHAALTLIGLCCPNEDVRLRARAVGGAAKALARAQISPLSRPCRGGAGWRCACTPP